VVFLMAGQPNEEAISKRGGPVTLRGDEERLFSEQRQRLVRILHRETGAPIALVEDGVSHAFEQLCRHQPKRDRVVGWLRVVARHEVFRLLRNLRREPLAEDLQRRSSEGIPAQPVPIAQQVSDPRTVELEIEAREALRLLASLGRNQRETLTLAAAGHSYAEIQRIRGVSYTNVNRHMTEGRAKARRLRDAA
jgi:RNA polymerase sigma factor (sigma-70 family)